MRTNRGFWTEKRGGGDANMLMFGQRRMLADRFRVHNSPGQTLSSSRRRLQLGCFFHFDPTRNSVLRRTKSVARQHNVAAPEPDQAHICASAAAPPASWTNT